MNRNIWYNFKRNLKFYFSRKINRALLEPDFFMISLTDNCNLSCKMCWCPETCKKYAGKELSSDEIKDIVDQIHMWAKHAKIVFSGGEPFVRKDIVELIDHVCSKHLDISINTNGMLIDEKIADKMASNPVQHLGISLDGDTSEVNDSIRGEGVFSRVLQTLHVLNEAKRKHNSSYPILSLNVTIMKQNIKGISNIVSLAKEHNVQYVFFQPIISDNTDFKKRKEYTFLNNEELETLTNVFKKIKLQAKENQINLQIPSLSLLKEYFTVRGNNYSRRKWKCFVGYNRISISSFGHVYSCSEQFGEVRECGIKEIWYSERANRIRKTFKKCQQFCLQTCYARPESESMAALIKNIMVMVLKKYHKRND